ncbi:unnamed protein product [Rhizophagus irregularis]|uniref:Uncharacterized protein n=1 Tax=Rhizophagus irregularis TaxID=588596 RepID=A0A915ZVU4_9GLOM|nr:unnamed protein product [Rhizophagus irregularis]
MEGADIETAIRDIRGTSVAHLEPNRTKDQNKRAKNTLPDISENQENQNIIWNSTYEFPLESGWALKSKQKYGKKGGGKRISKRVWKLLEEYFLEGDVDKSKRFTATTMLENLRNKVEERELDEEEIPKLQTIQGWISRYSAQHRQKMAEMFLFKLAWNQPFPQTKVVRNIHQNIDKVEIR